VAVERQVGVEVRLTRRWGRAGDDGDAGSQSGTHDDVVKCARVSLAGEQAPRRPDTPLAAVGDRPEAVRNDLRAKPRGRSVVNVLP